MKIATNLDLDPQKWVFFESSESKTLYFCLIALQNPRADFLIDQNRTKNVNPSQNLKQKYRYVHFDEWNDLQFKGKLVILVRLVEASAKEKSVLNSML